MSRASAASSAQAAADALMREGLDCFKTNEPARAMQLLLESISNDPDNIHRLRDVAGQALLYHQYVDAIRLYQSVVERDPGDEMAWLGIADAYYLIGDSESALKFYEHLIQKFPKNVTIRLADALFLPPIAESAESIRASRARLLSKIAQMEKEGFTSDHPMRDMRSTLFYLNYHAENPKPVAQSLATFFSKLFPGLHYTAPHTQKPRKQKPAKLKLGFISPNMHEVLINQFFLGIFKILAADADFEIVLISNAPVENDTVRELRKDYRYVALPLELEASRELIAREELDILVYLEIGIHHQMYALACARLAHMQCVWGGVPATTGIPAMDYFLTCRDAEPENCAEHYTETPAMTSRTLCLIQKSVPLGAPPPRSSYGIPEGKRIYACPVMPPKLHPDMDKIFAEILRRDPDSIITLCDPGKTIARQQLIKRFTRTIPPEHAARILFLPMMLKGKFLHYMREVDCLLDPFHYSFGSTAYLAFGADAPFVTLPGPYMSSRAGMRMYNRVGVPELIAKNPEDYVEIALKLAQDKTFYQDVTQRIAAKSDIFFNDTGVVDEFRDLLKQLYFL